jgi:NAD(P)-dependent dehydrogenase (short-subunit alcohol dehydrogenase family)
VGEGRRRRVVIVGLARQGKALARYFADEGADVVITDLRSKDDLRPAMEELADLPLQFALGGHPESCWRTLLCLSGVRRPLAQQRAARDRVTNTQLFLEVCSAASTASGSRKTPPRRFSEMAHSGRKRRCRRGRGVSSFLLADLSKWPTILVVMELTQLG